MASFNECVKYGDWGEKLVDNWMLNVRKSVAIYGPITEGSHPIDRSVYSKKNHSWFLYDVKTKKSSEKYKNQGIDLADYEKYQTLGLPVYIFFVDERLHKCYGGELNKIFDNGKIYMAEKENVIFADIANMKQFFKF